LTTVLSTVFDTTSRVCETAVFQDDTLQPYSRRATLTGRNFCSSTERNMGDIS